jgi:hypothetical protein
MSNQESRTSRKRKTTRSVDLNAQSVEAEPLVRPVPVPPIEIIDDADDDDVIIASPRAFALAKNNSRRSRGRSRVIIDIESDVPTIIFDDVERPKRRKLHAKRAINLERETVKKAAPPPPPPPPEPTFNCPVCIGPLVDEITTKCGHIFCKKCITTALISQKKCPTCRKKTTMKDIIRIYLPSTT